MIQKTKKKKSHRHQTYRKSEAGFGVLDDAEDDGELFWKQT